MLEWYVYHEDFNARKIEPHNVFRHGGFLEDCKKNAKANYCDKDVFIEQLRRDLMYYYWSKCEWEIVVGSLFENKHEEVKIDVFDQIRLNWGAFTEYVWANKEALYKPRKKKVPEENSPPST